MPIYNYSCKCGREWEAYVALRGSSDPLCSCGGSPERIWALGTTHRPGSGYPYVTTNIHPNGKPIEVTSDSHLQKLCREHGVTPRPDAAFINKTYEGVDFRTGKQKYKEGNGSGMPGCWV